MIEIHFYGNRILTERTEVEFIFHVSDWLLISLRAGGLSYLLEVIFILIIRNDGLPVLADVSCLKRVMYWKRLHWNLALIHFFSLCLLQRVSIISVGNSVYERSSSIYSVYPVEFK